MITLPYSLVIEATKESDFSGFYSPRSGMADHVQTLREQGLAVPAHNPNPTIVIQNESKLQPI